MFSINNFRSDLNRRGLLRNNRGGLLLPVPQGLRTSIDARDIAIRCEKMVLPGMHFAKQEGHRRYGYGPTDRNPESPSFEPFTCNFIVDKRGEVYKFFYDWVNLITYFDSSKGPRVTNSEGAIPYESSYPIEYVVDMNLIAYDEDGQTVIKYQVHRAWPSNFEEKEIAANAQDGYVSLGITFEYRDWNLKASKTNALTDVFNFGENKVKLLADNEIGKLVNSF